MDVTRPPRSRLRSVLRWTPPVGLGLVLVASWGLFLSGGMAAVVGWVLLIEGGQLAGPLSLLVLAVHAFRKHRFSRPMQATLALALRVLFRPGPIVPDRGAGSARLPAVAQCTAKRRHPKRGRGRSGEPERRMATPGAWSTRPGRLDTPLDWQGAGVNRETESTTDPVRRAVQELERRRRTETVPRRCTR